MTKIEQWVNSSIKESDVFWIGNTKYKALGQNGVNMICCTIEKDGIKKDGNDRVRILISNKDIIKKSEDYVGVNPFLASNVSFIAFDLENILSYIGYNKRDGIKWEVINDSKAGVKFNSFNWNPYFIIDGNKEYYQRGFVWSIEQKRNLIDSVYRGLECGRIIVHKKEWANVVNIVKAGYEDYSYIDIVDGKQRLSTLIDFIEDKFCDNYGNYYSDLSSSAKRKFMNYRGLLYGELDSNCSNEQICETFLNNVVGGVPMSIEHIEYMKSVRDKIISK